MSGRGGRGASGAVLKDPHGGLTRAGRDWFARTQGAHLQPGVKKAMADMTPEDMHRKGSWAVRFYGRKGALPPLRKPDGTPTRYALSAAAWGEAVPATVAAARKIAAKGHRLLAAYSRNKRGAGPPADSPRRAKRKANNRKAKPQSKSQLNSRIKAGTKLRSGSR